MSFHANQVRWNSMQCTIDLHIPTKLLIPASPTQTTRHQPSIPPASHRVCTPASVSVVQLETTFGISLHIPKHQFVVIPNPPSHDSTTPNTHLEPSAPTARVPTDLNPRRAKFAKPLVAQIRLRVSAARTEPFWSATWKVV